VLGGVANQAVHHPHGAGKVRLVGQSATPLGIAGGVAFLVVDINQVDVA
jgi:ribosomal protein L2